MSVVELRCPSCGAPVALSGGRAQSCKYCHAPLVVDLPAVEVDTHEEHYVRLEQVGPSNRERIVRLLAGELALEPAAAASICDQVPVDVGNWRDSAHATELCRQLESAGAAARVGTRIIETPRLPPRDVILEDPGAKRIQVIKVLREHLPIALAQAKKLVESTPCELARAFDGARADQLTRDLVAVGAKVRLI